MLTMHRIVVSDSHRARKAISLSRGLRRARRAFATNQEGVFFVATSLLSMKAVGGLVKWERVGGVAILPSGDRRRLSAQRARPPHISHLLDYVQGEKKPCKQEKNSRCIAEKCFRVRTSGIPY